MTKLREGSSALPVFAGELTVDMLVTTEHELPFAAEGRTDFSRETLPGEDWVDYLQQAVGELHAEIHVGGSIANVAASFVNDKERHRARFVAVGGATSGPVRRPLWWRGYNVAAADLTARLIQVLGPFDVAPVTPDTPGALVYLSPSGVVRRIVANAQISSRNVAGPQGTLLSIRTDHLRLLDPEYVAKFSNVALLLADDGGGWDSIRSITGRANAAWIFGKARQVEEIISRLPSVDNPHVQLIGTNGSEPCTILKNGAFISLPVPEAHGIVTDLGAGDAYMGGFMRAAIHGAGVEQAHAVGCEAASHALSSRGARKQVPLDLNKRLPAIDRSSKRSDEGKLFYTVRTSPGMTVITGGQTGVDSVAAESALHAGLPVHVIYPTGLRQEDGNLTDARRQRLAGARLHELGSESFRYRTWATTFMADVVMLLDRAGGEGSRETAAAAEFFNRPLWNLGTEKAEATVIAEWLSTTKARVVMIAGSRASLMAASNKGGGLDDQIQEVVEGIALRNTQLIAASQGAGSPELPAGSRVGIASAVLPWWERSGLDAATLPGEVVALTARGTATALARGEVDWAVTWPSLVPGHVMEAHAVYPLGVFPVHYGFVCGKSRVGESARLAIQYREAFTDHVPEFDRWSADAFEIDGLAEQWVSHGIADMAYDSYRTGRTMADHGLCDFYPTHWETLAIIVPAAMKGRRGEE